MHREFGSGRTHYPAFVLFALAAVCLLAAASPASAAAASEQPALQDATAGDATQVHDTGPQVAQGSCSAECQVGLSLASIFPLGSDRTKPELTDPDVVELSDDRADELFDVLASETARELLRQLGEEPKTATELTEVVDTSLQNVHYHLENLRAAGAIEELDVEYSERGREMSVYVATCRPRLLVYETS